jgi:hypothetical protein
MPGETLVEGRRNPVFDACRALHARGVTGRLEVRRRGKTSADLLLDIERGAGLAIKETTTESLRVVVWEPWRPRHDDLFQGCVSYRRVQPPAAADDPLKSASRVGQSRALRCAVSLYPHPAFQQNYRLTPIICGDHHVTQQGLHAGCSQPVSLPFSVANAPPPCAV